MNDALQKTEAFLTEKELLNGGDRVVAALSGGADSVAMLHLLYSLKEKYNLTIYAAHLNHMIRGEEADRDAAFCESFCERLGVPLFLEKADVSKLSRERKESEELCGRNERYRWFSELADRLGAKIATAHTASDNLETLLLHLTRGAGIAGLSGIPVKRGRIIRPVLCLTRDEIEDYCRDNGLDYVTDATNLSDDYARNKIRHGVIPILRSLNPEAETAAARMASVMAGADSYLRRISENERRSCRTAYGYSCEKLLRLDSIIRSYVLRQILAEAGADAEQKHIALLERALLDGGAVDLPGGFRAACSQHVLRIFCPGHAGETTVSAASREAESPDSDSCSESRLSVFGSMRLKDCPQIQYISNEELKNVHKKFFDNCISCDIISENTVLRTRRSGDFFRGRGGHTKTLKKLFNELKIPAERRSALRLIADGSRVLWIEGVGAAFDARPRPDEAGRALFFSEK